MDQPVLYAERQIYTVIKNRNTAANLLKVLKQYSHGGNYYSTLHYFLNRPDIINLLIRNIKFQSNSEDQSCFDNPVDYGFCCINLCKDEEEEDKNVQSSTYTCNIPFTNTEKLFFEIRLKNPGKEITYLKHIMEVIVREIVGRILLKHHMEHDDVQQELGYTLNGLCRVIFSKDLYEYLNTDNHICIKNIITISINICISSLLERLVTGSQMLTKNNAIIYQLPGRLQNIINVSEVETFTTEVYMPIHNKIQNSVSNLCINWLSKHILLDHNSIVEVGKISFLHYTHFV